MFDFGQFLKKEREKRNWTQSDLGGKIGINVSAISRIENGSQRFSKSKIKELSQLLEADIQTLTDLFFADKFANEAFRYKCSESVFTVAEQTSRYLRSKNSKQAKLEI
ncbi:MAG: helix-turn-helix transcriptional regulator [Cyclobacteriaceae bacterium]